MYINMYIYNVLYNMRLPVCLVDMNAIRSVFIGLHDTVPPGGGWEFVHDRATRRESARIVRNIPGLYAFRRRL